MICSYDKIYLDKARTALGRMLDFAVYDLHYDLEEFFRLFISSGIAERFENGEANILVGKSGIELAYLVLETSGIEIERVTPKYISSRSEEYWLGWALTYYQWKKNISFAGITRYISIKEILSLYSPYHEMDIRQFADKMDEMYSVSKKETNLKRLRHEVGLTQKELAEQSGVPLRTLQQYEQGQKNINKAAAEQVYALSKILVCNVKDLLE